MHQVATIEDAASDRISRQAVLASAGLFWGEYGAKPVLGSQPIVQLTARLLATLQVEIVCQLLNLAVRGHPGGKTRRHCYGLKPKCWAFCI